MDDEINQPVIQMSSLYQSLPSPDSFRILQLHPGIIAEPLICNFVEAELSQKPSYEALSYRWTDPNKENPDLVYCNGFDCPIGSNLYAALIRFRLADVPRALWVDQLCINQAEGPEKAQQLLIMGDIYSKAKRVLAWLGPAYDDSDKAMDIFPKLVDRLEILEIEKKMEKGNREMSIDNHTFAQVDSLPELERNNRRALHKLFSRQYFGRVWTLQELAVSNDTVIVCGNAEFPFAVLQRFNEGYQAAIFGYWTRALGILSESEDNNDPENPQRPINRHFQLVAILKYLDSSAFPLSSARVLTLLRDFECSNSDDRVYSFLRFLPPTLAQSLVAVKRKSTEALFIDLATFELTKNRSMDFLSAAGMCQHRRWYPSRKDDQSRPTLKLPTWVPDWTYWSGTDGLWVMNDECIRTGYGPLYQAADSPRGDVRFVILDNTGVLCVQGQIFDDIAACVEPFKLSVVSLNQGEDETFLQPAQDMIDTQIKEYWWKNDAVKYLHNPVDPLKFQADSCIALAKDCKRYDDDIGRTTACRQTLIGGMILRRIQSIGGGVHVKATDEEVNELFTEWDNVVETNELLKRTQVVMRLLNPQGSDLNEEDMLFLSRSQEMVEKMNNLKWHNGYAIYSMSLACKGRRFFTTTTGFMGLAPDIAQVGDKICLISGCCTPFIIRAEGPNFCLVGESYVHGVMDGELMSDITFEDINLV